MRNYQGGTRMYCPECQDETICKAIDPSRIAYESGQRWYRIDYSDLNWFRRGRHCLECGYEFLTAELDENFLNELVELRDSLADIKMNAESYIIESAGAAKSLERLSKSIEVLRALKIYKRE